MKQRTLFDPTTTLPAGLRYVEEFITRVSEAALLERIRASALTAARYKGYTALRKTLHYGYGYDFGANELTAAEPIPEWLLTLRDAVAREAALNPCSFVQALITQYAPGTPLGWHRDVPDYEVIAGVSLLGECRMRLRPYPPRANKREGVLALDLAPRSLYIMRDEARWTWQHSVPPVREQRYSVTFRTMRRTD